jgi:hypothetical protein
MSTIASLKAKLNEGRNAIFEELYGKDKAY